MTHSRAVAVLSAAFLSLAGHTPALCASLEDDVSLIQHAMKRDDNTSTEYGVAQWLQGFYTVIKPPKHSEDPLIKVCCDMVRRLKVKPRTTMGKANEKEQKWWFERECNFHVGADLTEDLDGSPNCRRGVDLPTPKSAIPFTGQSGCTEEDRADINA